MFHLNYILKTIKNPHKLKISQEILNIDLMDNSLRVVIGHKTAK